MNIISEGVFAKISHAAVNNNNDNGSKRYFLSNCLNCVVLGCDKHVVFKADERILEVRSTSVVRVARLGRSIKAVTNLFTLKMGGLYFKPTRKHHVTQYTQIRTTVTMRA